MKPKNLTNHYLSIKQRQSMFQKIKRNLIQWAIVLSIAVLGIYYVWVFVIPEVNLIQLLSNQ